MIRALLIDDEKLALLQLEKLLKDLTAITVAAAFTDPVKAVQAAAELKPDVIFLDIDMPELSGMQAAEMLHSVCPAADLVFVTAYNAFATEAFELNALDYVLKPVQRDRLVKTARRLEQKWAQPATKTPQTNNLFIRCFQTLRFERKDAAPEPIRWRTTKTQELFAYLLHQQNQLVHKDVLIEALWPEYVYDKAATLLYTTIYQLRKSLKQADINVSINNASGGTGYTLDLLEAAVDTVEWERSIKELLPLQSDSCEEHQRLVDLYSGDYFGDCDYAWAENERQRLRAMWLQLAKQVAAFYEDNGRFAEAISLYQRILQVQPYYEEGHWMLMKMYDSLGERAAVEGQFKNAQHLLVQELGIGMPETIESWYEQWKLHNMRQP
ncbi:response regulator [Paenibacillus sp. MBLB4367]|uniref:response regulator n=1 Tax=Paenibacillus sp. MBLB4367 TaxID=3384767 RepID=UPI0039080561